MSLRLVLILLVALFGSALAMVRVAHDSRRLVTALDRAEAQGLRLETEHEGLQAERHAEARPLRVERMAREKLAMRPASPGVTQYLALPGGAPAWPASRAPAVPGLGEAAPGGRP